MPHQSQQKPNTEESLFGDLWVWLLSNYVNSNKIQRTTTMFLKELHWQKHHQLGLKGTETIQNKTLLARRSLRNLISWKQTFIEKKE